MNIFYYNDISYYEDYEVSYENNIEPGTAYAVITGIGKYVNTKKVAYTIENTEAVVKRIAGANRYETAAKISEEMYQASDTDTAILVTGLDFHDALVAVPLARAYDAPLLLATEKHIKVIVVSTNGAIGAKAKAELAGYDITAIEGKNCFETASKVAKALQTKTKKAPDTIFFATDSAYADALSASPVAAIKGAPIIYLNNKKNLRMCSQARPYVYQREWISLMLSQAESMQQARKLLCSSSIIC